MNFMMRKNNDSEKRVKLSRNVSGKCVNAAL